ncbi:hypothetical protein EK21DRAFT_97801 [Setomelanomma holmii]|uniref:BTB/POZ domain-containing protein n=1 Tax=Setomelanomma holmii TaxID=210430 RepID=A0A9P4HJ89_9PLEO|nr:hypothetical protein EK21DRAFT_97801 [Setomelanomma holmii]
MTDRTHTNSADDFAFQTSDQASGASQQQQAQQVYGHYDAERDTNPSSRYQDFGVPQQQQYAGYGFSPSAPLNWDWTNSIDFSDFTNQYEPQGELVQELQQPVTTNDFSIPLPIEPSDQVFQTPQHSQSATPAPANTQNPLSPPPKPPQRPVIQTGMKRKADSEPGSAVSQPNSAVTETQQHQAKRATKSRQSSATSVTSPVVAEPVDARQSPMAQTASAPPAPEPIPRESNELQRRKEQSKGTGPQGRVIDVSKPRRVQESPVGLDMLPAGKVFPIQIGSDLFRLSGASLSSDAPSYFSHFFGEQLNNNGGRAGDVRTLYIDRDPDTFRQIALHLQGYHITPKDGEQFVKLFADAQFYSLPRLTKQLFSTDIFIRIGGMPFQIPRDLFSAPGDSPNYFSLGFAQFFSTPSEVFPGLDRNALLRPPSISPPSAPNRNGETFAELIQILQGYDIEIRSEEHRSQLLRDARYFHLKGLEQRLVPCEISYNLKRQQSEILIRLEDIRQSGISFSADKAPGDSDSSSQSGAQSNFGYVSYARPYTDDNARTNILILEVSARETTTLYLPTSPPPSSQSTLPTLNLRATFHNATLARITSLFSVIASKMGLPATQPLGLMYLQTGSGVAAQPVSPANSGVSERRVRVRIDADTALEMDGAPASLCVDAVSGRIGIRRSSVAGSQRRVIRIEDEWLWGGPAAESNESLRTAAAADDDEQDELEWIVKRAQWRLRVEPVEYEGERRMQVVLCGVKIEAFSVERRRNVERVFLGGV